MFSYEKKEIQDRILEVIDEIAALSKEYVILRDQILNHNEKFSREKVLEEYVKESKTTKYKNTYNVISLYVASLLNYKGVPTKSKIIYEYLVKEKQLTLSYNNFQSNYLKKIYDDNNISVERAYRGYYQYRRKDEL